MTVKGLNNFLVAGRCISATHEAMSSTRVAPISGALGEAAGTAASLSARYGAGIRDISIEKLQEQLAAGGAILSDLFYRDKG